jgi:hypothetical protein
MVPEQDRFAMIVTSYAMVVSAASRQYSSGLGMIVAGCLHLTPTAAR